MEMEASASLGRISVVSAAILCSTLLLVGCGGSGSNTTTQNTTPATVAPAPSQPAPTPSGTPPGGTGTTSGGTSGSPGGTTGGTSTPGGSSSGSSGGGTSGGGSNSGGSGADNSTAITGTILDAQTNAPVSGDVVVALEGANPSDFGIMAQTTADAQGHFRFDNVQPSPRGWGWTIAVSARSSDGTLFAPTLLISHNHALGSTGDAIEPGTDTGAITLMPSPKGEISGNIFSQNSAGKPQNVKVTIDPLQTFTLDRHFVVPWIDGPPQFLTQDTDAPTCATATESCAFFSIKVPTANVWMAMYDHTGNQFKSSSTPQDYSAFFNATSETTGMPDCNPSSLEKFLTVSDSGSTSNSSHFQNCTP